MNRIYTLGLAIAISINLTGCFVEGNNEGPPTEYDSSRFYYLPWEYGLERGIVQSYQGSHGHKSNHITRGEYAIDAVMPEGSLVVAARDGTVSDLDESHNFNCSDGKDGPSGELCRNNFVKIIHADGSYGEYLHLGLNGACVISGDRVFRGDIIAYSGHVGISFLPHLHFHVGNTATPPTFVDVNAGGTGIPRASTRTMPMYISANSVGRNFCLERGIPKPILAN